MNPILTAIHFARGSAVRLFYRIAAPTHPRGWLDFHCVDENNAEHTLWIHRHGMEPL